MITFKVTNYNDVGEFILIEILKSDNTTETFTFPKNVGYENLIDNDNAWLLKIKIILYER